MKMKALLTLIILLCLIPNVVCHVLTIATYNLWNVMFNWDVRKYRIAQMIKEVAPDIIAFQEVRQNTEKARNQLQDIQQLVPWLMYDAFSMVQKVTHKSDAYHKEWTHEGLGILSQYPFILEVQNLTHSFGQDENHRAVLHCRVKHPLTGDILVSVVHLSYDKNQQCRNVMEISHQLNTYKIQNKIILGDFNVYSTFPWPVQLLLDPSDNKAKKKCLAQRMSAPNQHSYSKNGQYIDVWKKIYPDNPGLTFSNMPKPGLESRPDRIFGTKDIFVISATLLGDGRVYKSRFHFHVYWNRVRTAVSVMFDSKRGLTGRACLHDCGPHASCRCGICVSGGDHNICNVPDCPECDEATLNLLLVFGVIAIILVIQLLYATLRVLQAMNNRSHRSCCVFLCCDWLCLCDLVFYTYPRDFTSRTRLSRPNFVSRFWPLCKLPPMVLVLVTLLLGCVYIQTFMMTFGNLVHHITAIIPEEMFPSDHRMLSATLKLKK